jgi:hypothetical protein
MDATHAFSQAYSNELVGVEQDRLRELRPSAWALFEVDHEFKGYRLSTGRSAGLVPRGSVDRGEY